MDLRVLIGVFVTLFGIAVGMAGGDIQSQDVMGAMQNGEVPSDGLSGFPSLSSLTDLLSFTPTKPANTSISADLTSAEEIDINVKTPATLTLHVATGSRITAGDATFQARGDESPATVTLRGFTGQIRTAGNLSVDGNMNGLHMSVMSLNYSRNPGLSATEGVQRVELTELEHQHVSFEEAEGTISTGSIDTTLTEQQASFRFFRGDLTVSKNASSYRYQFDGKVHKGMLGNGESQLVIGGE